MLSRPPPSPARPTLSPVAHRPAPHLRDLIAEARQAGAALASLPVGADPVRHARSVALQALVAFWEEHRAQDGTGALIVPCPMPVEHPGDEAARVAGRFGLLAARLPHSISGYLLSSLYASLLPESLRSAQGVFFTPPPLVARLLDMAEAGGLDWKTAKVLDPAAGGGAFLAPAAVRMAAALTQRGTASDDILDHIADHLCGLELDPFSTWVGHVLLETALWDHCVRSGRRVASPTLVGDALQVPDAWRTGFDLVVGNPPYGRATLPRAVRARFERSLFGHANLYGLFTDLAVRLTKPGGLIAYVTPTSFLGGLYFKKLRGFLADAAPPTQIDFVADRDNVFAGVLQETLLVVYAPARQNPELRVSEIRASGLEHECEISALGTYPAPANTEAPWVLPRTSETTHLIDLARNTPGRISDYRVKVSTGPLVWNRHKDQLADKCSHDCHPLVWAESVPEAGIFRYGAKKRNHKPYFRLLPGQEHLLQTRPCVLVQRTTAKEQRRRLIAALLPQAFLDEHGGVVVENHLNMVRPLDDHLPVSLESINALLGSRIVDQIFRCVSGSVAVSAFELESLPVPSVKAMLGLDALLRSGGTDEEIEAYLMDAYEKGA
jgi:adenine-specific DNA-methyltransferase